MTPEATIREVFETNVFGVMAVAQAVIPYFRERGAGTLIKVTSSVAVVPKPLVSVYVASKLAIEGFTESLAYELACFGVGAKLVEPGYGPTTSFIANAEERMKGLISPPYAAYAEQLIRRLRGGKSTGELDVANAVWLATNDGTRRLRFPAGADAEELAATRRAFAYDDYLDTMYATLSPEIAAPTAKTAGAEPAA